MSQDFDISEFKSTYFEECYELLQVGMEDLEVLKHHIRDQSPFDEEHLHSIFRCVHSIKGGAGAFGFHDLINFSHEFETLLDQVRDHKIELSMALVDLLIRSYDMLEKLVDATHDDTSLPQSEWQSLANTLDDIAKGNLKLIEDQKPNRPPEIQTPDHETPKPDPETPLSRQWVSYDLTAQEEDAQGWGLYVDETALNDLINAHFPLETANEGEAAPKEVIPSSKEESQAPPQSEEDQEKDLSPKSAPPKPQTVLFENQPDDRAIFKITFVPDRHLLKFANEPLLLVRELKTLGDLQVETDFSRLPPLAQMKSDEAYLSWIFHLKTHHSRDDILEVFEFVIDDCTLRLEEIEPAEPVFGDRPEADDPVEPEHPVPQATEAALEEITPETQDEHPGQSLDEPISTPLSEPPNPPKPIEKPQEEITQAQQPPEPQPAASGWADNKQRVSSIRVDLERVDKLVNMIGELVITQAMLKEETDGRQGSKDPQITQRFDELNAHTRELQAGVMAIRMQPVKTVFGRLPRLVRELSTKLNKKVDLILSGEMTEVDKTVIEQLMDPLVHMIRNSLDHGIETPEERLKHGKPETAQIHLSAHQRNGRINIEVSDDGAGINRERVRQKALEKGLIAPNDPLSDQDIDELIFEAGFTTAQTLSDVSGRGVGMDVVSRNLASLGGRVGVVSTPGKGATFVLSLPLTLAVMEGMIVRCGAENYILPLSSVIENIYPQPTDLKTLVTGKTVIMVQDEFVPLLFLHRLFKLENAIEDLEKALIILIETEQFGLVGLVVDELIGQQQVVIKSLEENYDLVPGVAAATILGTGRVALILDVDGLAEMEHGAHQRRNYKKISERTLLTGEIGHGQK